MAMNDKDYEKINEAAKTLQEYAEQIRPIIEETMERIRPLFEAITDVLLSVLNDKETMQKLIDEVVKDEVVKKQVIDLEKDNDNNNDIN